MFCVKEVTDDVSMLFHHVNKLSTQLFRNKTNAVLIKKGITYSIVSLNKSKFYSLCEIKCRPISIAQYTAVRSVFEKRKLGLQWFE